VGQQFLVVGPGWLGSKVAEALGGRGSAVWTLQRSAPPPRRRHRCTRSGVIFVQPATRPHGDGSFPRTWTASSSVSRRLACSATAMPPPTLPRYAVPWNSHTPASCPRLLYTSSTGVYGRTDGGVSREGDAIVVADARQGALRDAELVLNADLGGPALDRIILRVAGLYGPGRDPAPRFQVSVPAADDDVWCNFAWRDDVVEAITHLMTTPAVSLPEHASARPSARPSARVFNCADGVPLRASRIARALGASEENASAGAVQRMRPAAAPSGRSNQQIVVDALRATGWQPRMTTVYDGLRALGHHVRASDVAAAPMPERP
jgi:nucleoside-diphosphate-sugar epimerase